MYTNPILTGIISLLSVVIVVLIVMLVKSRKNEQKSRKNEQKWKLAWEYAMRADKNNKKLYNETWEKLQKCENRDDS